MQLRTISHHSRVYKWGQDRLPFANLPCAFPAVKSYVTKHT